MQSVKFNYTFWIGTNSPETSKNAVKAIRSCHFVYISVEVFLQKFLLKTRFEYRLQSEWIFWQNEHLFCGCCNLFDVRRLFFLSRIKYQNVTRAWKYNFNIILLGHHYLSASIPHHRENEKKFTAQHKTKINTSFSQRQKMWSMSFTSRLMNVCFLVSIHCRKFTWVTMSCVSRIC